MRRVRDRPGLTAEMERWDKATSNLILMQQHGLSASEIREHRERMAGLAKEADALPTDAARGIFVLTNRIAIHAGESALLNYLNWREASIRFIVGEPGSREFLEQTAHEIKLRVAQHDYRWAVDFLEAHGSWDKNWRDLVLADRSEWYMHPDAPDEMEAERSRLLGRPSARIESPEMEDSPGGDNEGDVR